jgi:hypothetical protein
MFCRTYCEPFNTVMFRNYFEKVFANKKISFTFALLFQGMARSSRG